MKKGFAVNREPMTLNLKRHAAQAPALRERRHKAQRQKKKK
jgi:hypothetical protein